MMPARGRVRMQFLDRFTNDESGATSIEYVMIAAFASIAVASGAGAIGLNLIPIFADVLAGLQ